ncbi:SEL1-like repeat protein [Providencia stuartii]|nr:SEL1-like repeat protein [Providencia stuartii]
MYENGEGTEMDDKAASEYLNKACKGGLKEACKKVIYSFDSLLQAVAVTLSSPTFNTEQLSPFIFNQNS